ncbi:MAG: hypothetical protein VW397_09130, partial [Candidatus Margulisiibacteriota bacterium]
MLGAFGKNIQAGDGSFIGETFGWVGQGVASGFNELLRPLIMSFVPGSAGYDISSGMMDLFGDFSNEILGDLFKPDRQKILNLLQNRHQGSRHSMGIQPDSVDDMLNDISQEMNSDIGDINLENLSHYFFRLTIDSQFIPYQNDIDLFLQNQGLYDEISPADFTFLTTIEDQNALFEELKSYEYIIWNDNFSRWVVNYDFDLPEGNFFFTLPYASDFRSYQAEVDGFLQSMGLYDDISPESFTFLDSPNEQTSLFNELKQLNYISYNTN